MNRRADIVCGGFPCQDLSVAGKRAGLAGERSGLFHEFIRIVRKLQPALVVIENVPGLISSHAGHDFRVVLDSLAKCGALDICWRTLDSRYFNLAQRRERVFLVADFRGQRAAEILFESACGCRNSPQGQEARQGVASTIRSRSHRAGVNPPGRGGEDDRNLVVGALNGNDGGIDDNDAQGNRIVYQETGQEFWREGLPSCSSHDGKETDTANASGAYSPGQGGTVIGLQRKHYLRDEMGGAPSELSPTLTSAQAERSDGEVCVAFHERRREGGRQTETQDDLAFCLESSTHDKGGGRHQNVVAAMGVRRLMPVECLRLQGFPDDWLSLDPPLADSTKYRMIGNAVSVTVADWIARRILILCPKLRTYLSLFTGMGGFDLGFDRAGLRCIGQVEKDRHCLRLLSTRWPDVTRHDDVRTFARKRGR